MNPRERRCCGRLNDFGVFFQVFQSQKTVIVGSGNLRVQIEPLVVGIEFGHDVARYETEIGPRFIIRAARRDNNSER